ncbi:unnamed protein product, partial [Hapterophycus canaliculatus]
MLYDFCQRQGERKVSATYLVMGRNGAAGSGAMEVKLVSAEGLDSARKGLETVTSVHVYSVQAAPCSQPAADLSMQLWATDLEHTKEMVEETTDAGVNLRSHRLSGVRCPESVDVPVPKAPPPPEHVQEESPFGPRGGATGGGNGGGAAAASTAAAGGRKNVSSKPKGKAIAPKDFFAGA